MSWGSDAQIKELRKALTAIKDIAERYQTLNGDPWAAVKYMKNIARKALEVNK